MIRERNAVAGFLVLVLVIMAFYCLGLMLGRSDKETVHRPAAPARETSKKSRPDETDPRSQLDFLNSSAGDAETNAAWRAGNPAGTPGGGNGALEEKSNRAHAILAVQVGAFEKQRDAQRVADELFRRGYSTRIVSPSGNRNDSKFRVYVGSYPDRAHGEAVVKELSKLGYKAKVTAGSR